MPSGKDKEKRDEEKLRVALRKIYTAADNATVKFWNVLEKHEMDELEDIKGRLRNLLNGV